MSSIIITEFLFDDENEEEIAQHGLSPDAVLQVLENPNIVGPNRRKDYHRGSHLVIGRDNGGRPITIPVEATHIPELWRPVTAWPSGKWDHAELEKRGI